MSNKFCRFLSNGYSINLNESLNESLLVKPCCWYEGGLPLDADRAEFNNITDWTPACQICQQQEQAGYKSFRQSSFDILSESDDLSIIALDINIDYNCNAACVICDEKSSSLWHKQLTKHKIIHIAPNYNPQLQLDYILANIDLSELRRIKFFGGEPLLTDTHIQVLKKIPNPRQVDIWYTTNASIIPSADVLDIWSKFKLVYVEASIDGINEQFNYIRWPLQWNKIESNLLTLKESAPVNVLFRINHTLNPFNIYYYSRLETWVADYFSANRLGDPTEINIHPCWGIWALDRTPRALRDLVQTTYPNHDISRLLAHCDFQTPDTILKFTDKWDLIRKNSWKTAFPEIIEYFET